MKALKLEARKLSKFYSVAELEAIMDKRQKQAKTIIGQKRALRALEFGLGNKTQGFNVYVAGSPGTGKLTAVRHYLKHLAIKEDSPKDWCYVNNFKQSYSPKWICLPKGYGLIFKKEIKKILLEARFALNRTMNSKEYAAKKEALGKELQTRERDILDPISQKAKKEHFLIQRTLIDINIYPEVDGRRMTEEEFDNLDEKKKERILQTRDEFRDEFFTAAKNIGELHSEFRNKQENLDRNIASKTIEPILEKLKVKYKSLESVLQFLEDLKVDLLERLQEFMQFSADLSSHKQSMLLEKEGMMPLRYEVNVIVDNTDLKGAPIVIEQNPTYINLFGKIEKEHQNGTLTTNLTLIRGGALHRANGGYLLLPIEGVLRNYFSWDSLKRALKNQEIVIEEPGEQLGFLTSRTLKPKPIPLNLQVILTGKPIYYHLLYHYDEDFKKLFKVKADFDTIMEASDENVVDFIAFLDRTEAEEQLLPLSMEGKSRLLTYSHRLAGDQLKMSSRFGDILDVLREANHYAANKSLKQIDAALIEKTLEEKHYRANLWQEKIHEMIRRNELFIDLEGSIIGQVNGIAVIGIGEFAFGKPSRITASVSLGKSEIIDIEREVNLGGPIHSKGVMILKGYLTEKFGQDKILNLSARLVFEQSYSGVEGDSASSAELYAILSGLSRLPIRQGIAVTGSVNQKGIIQPVGGINEKVEGFFEVCKQKGLTGKQGVLIPTANQSHLILKKEVLDAIEKRKFHIWAVETIDQGIEILTGVKAGQQVESDPPGLTEFEKDTVFDKINQQLRFYSKIIRSLNEKDEKPEPVLAPAE